MAAERERKVQGGEQNSNICHRLLHCFWKIN